MVAFGGDYAHGGTLYDSNHTRIFMGLTMVEDLDINTTHLEGETKTPPSDVKGDGEDVEAGEGRSRGNFRKGRENERKVE